MLAIWNERLAKGYGAVTVYQTLFSTEVDKGREEEE